MEDIYFLTGCFPIGKQFCLCPADHNRFEFVNHKISQTVAKYSSLGINRQVGQQEEFDFYLECLLKCIFCNRWEKVIKYMVAMSNHLCQATKLQAFAPFLIGLFDAASRLSIFPAFPAEGRIDLAIVPMGISLFPEPRSPQAIVFIPSLPYGEELKGHCLKERWSPLSITGNI